MSQQMFHYRARDRQGRLVTGAVEANSSIEAKRTLSARQLVVLEVGSSLTDKMLGALQKVKDNWAATVPLEELIVFNRQLQTAYSVGLPMLQALTLMAEQSGNETLRRSIKDVIEEVTQGRAFHDALARHPLIFDGIYVNAIKAGEASGQLDQVLSMLSYFAEQRMENEAKIKSATLYPKIVLGGIAMVLVTVFTFVLPKFREFYGRFGGELPPLTLFVLGISEFFQHYWYVALTLGAAGYFFGKQFLRTPKGHALWHRLVLKVPVFGVILLQHDILTFATVLQLLVKAGIPIIEALEIVRDSLRNQLLKDEIEACRNAIQDGQEISSGFKKSKVFPKMVGSLMAVGEEGGKLDEVLGKIASYYKVQLEYRLNNLAKAIEPVFLFIIFGVVLVLVLAIFLPIWKMSQLIKMH